MGAYGTHVPRAVWPRPTRLARLHASLSRPHGENINASSLLLLSLHDSTTRALVIRHTCDPTLCSREQWRWWTSDFVSAAAVVAAMTTSPAQPAVTAGASRVPEAFDKCSSVRGF